MMKTAVIGCGAMGTLFAARLSARSSVSIIGSWKEQLHALKHSGLALTDTSGLQTHYVLPVQEYATAEGPFEIALILVKGWQTVRAAETAKKVLAPDGLALTLQNGLGNYETLANILGEHQAAMGVTSEGAMVIGPGQTQHTGIGVTHFGRTKATEDRLEKVATLFQNSGFETRHTHNLDGLVWGKLAVNAGINPLTALMQVRNGFLAKDDIAQDLMCRAAEETATVAERQGIRMPYKSASERIIKVAIATAANRSSMAQDIARGAPTEIDSINGMVVQIGAIHGVQVPVNRALLKLVKCQIINGDWRIEIDTLADGLRQQFQYLSNRGDAS